MENALYTVVGFLSGTTLATSVFDHADVWAPTVNTFLLVMLAILARKNGRRIKETHADVKHATSASAAAASSAAAAAEAAGTSARIAKEFGSNLRGNDGGEPGV